MLRVHFGQGDLGQTRVAAGPDQVAETLLSLHVLFGGESRQTFREWRTTVRATVAAMPDARQVRLLVPLVSAASLLSAVDRGRGIDDGLRALVGTSPAVAYAGLRGHRPPKWVDSLARGDSTPLMRLCDMLRDYHGRAVAPYWQTVCARVDADRAVRARTLLNGGADGLLSTLSPYLRWHAPVLEIETPDDGEVHLTGSGLLLLPVVFGPQVPVVLASAGRQPLLLYPVPRGPERRLGEIGPVGKALTRLMGRTRALLLYLASEGATTGELARRASISESSASEHLTVLRQAGLVATSRHGKTAVHSLTSVGSALLGQVGAANTPLPA